MSGSDSLSSVGRKLFSDTLTTESLDRIIAAFVRYLRDEFTPAHSLAIAIGFDGRRHSRDFALRASEIISKCGIGVLRSSGTVPVAALSLAAKRHGCAAGIMITGGSAPPDEIGIEFKGSSGAPFTKSAMLKIGTKLSDPLAPSSDIPAPLSANVREIDFLPEYQSYLRSAIDITALTSFALNPINNANVLIDSMGGAGQTIIEDILASCGWRAQTLFGASQPDFFDRHPKPVPDNLSALRYNVKVIDAQMGIATNGDAGGCGIILENGDWLDVQTMTEVLLWHLIEQKKWRGKILKSSINSKTIQKAISDNLISVIEKKFEDGPNEIPLSGCFLDVSDEGEFSFGPDLPDHDGILTGLLFTEIIALSGKPLRKAVDFVRNSIGHDKPTFNQKRY